MIYKTYQDYRDAWAKAFAECPPVPLNVDIELASACNAKCSFCLYGDRDWDASMREPDWDGRAKRRFMPTDMALRLVDECARIGVPALKMNFRGESTLHADYWKIMAHARRTPIPGTDRCSCHLFGHHPAFHDILVNTNGNCPDRSLPGLMCATKVMVSLDSMVPETYARIRVGLDLEHAKRTIDHLVRERHPNLWVRRVVCKSNKDEPFYRMVREMWPNGVRVSEHYAFDRNHYADEEVTNQDWSEWPRRYCGYPSQRVVVEASGRYVPCCIAWGGEFDAGRWPDTPIMDYWNSEFRKNLSGELRGNVLTNDKCKNCTSFMAYAVPQRDFVSDVEVTA